MKILSSFRILYLSLIVAALLVSACSSDDDSGGPMPTGNSETYALGSVSNTSISGTATFAEMTDGSTSVTIVLIGTTAGNSHPAHIHDNTAAEGGGIAIALTDVEGGSGTSTTIVTANENGDPLTYAQLIDFDGYINVHSSDSDLATLIAQGDIGQNELTGESKEYNLGSVSDPDISGTATFYARANEETLVVLSLNNTDDAAIHPSHIHDNTAAEGGGIAVSLSDVSGADGISKTNVSQKDDGTPITYAMLTDFDGYINVHNSATDLGTLVSQGDIGQNALTGNSEVYELSAVDINGVIGTATFYERANNETLVVISLSGATFADHPTHIHDGSVAQQGPIAISLSNVNEEGISKTNVTVTDNVIVVTYSDMIDYNGYINVHNSSSDLGTLVAQGNIGANSN